jgi:IS30 family transposase
MGTRYEQLSLEERCAIARLRGDGQSIRTIATSLDRAASTIARELKRNSGSYVGYKPAYADEQAWARRWRGSRLVRQPTLQQAVLNRLAMGWSPEQVAGRLAREHGSTVISHESIYRFIYAQIRRTNTFDWRRYLPRAKFKRGYRGRKGGSPVDHIKDRVSIAQRPAYIGKRRQPGHWETDYLLFSRYGQSLLVAQERASRFILLAKPPSRKAEPTATQLHEWLAPMPVQLRRTLTQDNGTEFADHYKLRDALGIKTYFCNPHSPWQKGGIENANGRLRRFLPRKTNLADVHPADIDAIASRYNNTPRKCLGFKTPAELFSTHLLHFKCESTSPLSRG